MANLRSVSAELGGIFGPARVSVRAMDLDASSRDCWPRALIKGLPVAEERPLAVVWPEHVEEVAALVELARREGFVLAPLGAGSGVCGGFWPDSRTVVVDLKRLTDFRVSEDGAEVHVGAGLLGWTLEERLARLGKTAGHFPSSILCSTVGGWVAARGAGQCSGRYGKIEDMVTELECVLGNTRVLTTRVRRCGPQLASFMVGCEGSLGIVTRVGLRLFPAPGERAFLAFSFPTFEMGQEALRAIYQSGLRPAVARLYDSVDSVLHASSKSGEDVHAEPEPHRKSWLSRDGLEAVALRGVLAAPKQLGRLVDLLEQQGRARSRLLLLFENVADPAEEGRRAAKICEELEGESLGEQPVRHWLEHRYDVSFRQSKVFRAGAFSDTMEVAAPWSKLAAVYRSVKAAVASQVLLMAHVSHSYPDGAAIYFTFVGRGRSREQALLRYDGVWADALAAAVQAGACVSHHHGVGRSKAGFFAETGGAAARRVLYEAWDPAGVMNPGVFGFGDRSPVEEGQREEASSEAPFVLDEVSQLAELDMDLTLDEADNLLFKRGFSLGPAMEADFRAAPDLTLGEFVSQGLVGMQSPWDDPVARPIAGFVGRLHSGEAFAWNAAPRRAEGPDLTAFFVGAENALGKLERATWALARRGVTVDPTPGVRPAESVPNEGERAAFEEVRHVVLSRQRSL